jgi:hypothetical protein
LPKAAAIAMLAGGPEQEQAAALVAARPHVTVDQLDHTTTPQIRRAISKSIDSALRCDGVDFIAGQADVHQLSVTQAGQGGSASAPKRTPISLEQA